MVDKKMEEEASGLGFHLLVHHFLVDAFSRFHANDRTPRSLPNAGCLSV